MNVGAASGAAAGAVVGVVVGAAVGVVVGAFGLSNARLCVELLTPVVAKE